MNRPSTLATHKVDSSDAAAFVVALYKDSNNTRDNISSFKEAKKNSGYMAEFYPSQRQREGEGFIDTSIIPNKLVDKESFIGRLMPDPWHFSTTSMPIFCTNNNYHRIRQH